MVLQGVEVSQITNVLLYLIQLCCAGLSICLNLGLPFKSHFKSIKHKLSSYISNMLWQMVSEEV